MAENPFYHYGPIQDLAYFYNRESETRRVLESIERGQNISLIGPRKIGMTSLLRHLCKPPVLQEYVSDPDRYLFVFLSCEALNNVRYEAFLAFLLKRIARQAALRELAFEVEKDEVTFLEFEEAIRDLCLSNGKIKVVLLLDEFAAVSSNPDLHKRIFPGLRSLAQESLIIFVTASTRDIFYFSQEYSPFFNIFVSMKLGLFGEPQTRTFIERSLARAGATLEPQAIDRVLEWGGRHPFFLQVAAFWALEQRKAKQGSLKDRDLVLLRHKVFSQVEPHYRYYWEHLEPEEQYVLAALPITQDQQAYLQQLESLEALCLAVRVGERYGYFSPLFRDFVRRQEAPDLLQTDPLVLVEPMQCVLLHDQELPLSPRQFALLRYLMQRANRVVEYEELDREVMARPSELQDYEYLGDGRLKSTIRDLRRTLGEHSEWVANVSGIGYMLQIERQEPA